MKEYSTWYFTFGCGQKHAGYCQPIKAPSYGSARAKMFEMYGAEWAFQYSEQEWNETKNNPNRWWELEKELAVVTVSEEEFDE